MTDTITIKGLTLWGRHGVFDHEKHSGQTFIIDLVIQVDMAEAIRTDNVEHTVNYAEVLDRVEAVVTGEPVDLIETLAARIADTVVEDVGVLSVTVTVHKPEAPVTQKVDDIAVSITRPQREVS